MVKGVKTTDIQILLALDRVVGVDMRKFLYRFRSGRLWNDYDIMIALGGRNIEDAVESVEKYSSDAIEGECCYTEKKRMDQSYINTESKAY